MLAAHFDYGRSGYILAHVTMTIWARDFKFAGAIVQSLYLVIIMVALTKNRLSWKVTYAVANHTSEYVQRRIKIKSMNLYIISPLAAIKNN